MSDFFTSHLREQSGDAACWLERDAQSNPSADAAWSTAEAFVAILFSAVASDGDFDKLEQEHFVALCHRSRALKQLDANVISAVMTSVLARLAAGGDAALAQACAALPAEMRSSAFAHALDLVSGGGEIRADEAAFLDVLAAALGLGPSMVEQIASVILLKNRY